VLIFSFDLEGGDEEAKTIIQDGRLPIDSTTVRQMSLYKNYFARQNRNLSEDKQLAEPLKYLVVVELDKPSDSEVGGKDSSANNVVTASYNLLKAFGEADSIVLN
jgi:hypothetical protein